MTSSTLIAGNWYRHHALPWAPDAHRDQQLGGGATLSIAELVVVPFLLTILAQWARAERAEAASLDRRLQTVFTPSPALRGQPQRQNVDLVRPGWETEDSEVAERIRRQHPRDRQSVPVVAHGAKCRFQTGPEVHGRRPRGPTAGALLGALHRWHPMVRCPSAPWARAVGYGLSGAGDEPVGSASRERTATLPARARRDDHVRSRGGESHGGEPLGGTCEIGSQPLPARAGAGQAQGGVEAFYLSHGRPNAQVRAAR